MKKIKTGAPISDKLIITEKTLKDGGSHEKYLNTNCSKSGRENFKKFRRRWIS